MKDCIFCKVIRGELPGYKIYETPKTVTILDINPVNPGHALVLPKEHYPTMVETPDDVLDEMIRTVKKIAPVLMKVTGTEGFNLGVNNGSRAGQLIFHTHFHVMPRRAEDGYRHWPGKPYKEGEIVQLTEKLKQALQS